MDGLQEVIWQALLAILVALVGLVTRSIIQWLNTKGITEKLEGKEYIVRWLVNGAEQAYKHEDGKKKRDIVKQKAIDVLNKNGLDVGVTELNELIEAMVFEMNKAKQENTTTIELESKELPHYKDEVNLDE